MSKFVDGDFHLLDYYLIYFIFISIVLFCSIETFKETKLLPSFNLAHYSHPIKVLDYLQDLMHYVVKEMNENMSMNEFELFTLNLIDIGAVNYEIVYDVRRESE